MRRARYYYELSSTPLPFYLLKRILHVVQVLSLMDALNESSIAQQVQVLSACGPTEHSAKTVACKEMVSVRSRVRLIKRGLLIFFVVVTAGIILGHI